MKFSTLTVCSLLVAAPVFAEPAMMKEKPAAPMMKEPEATPAARLGTLAPNTGLAVGTQIPKLSGKDLDGKEVSLASLHKSGPILIAFYRGGWCPFCNAEIHSLTTAFPEFQKRGITPVAISVDTPDNESKTKALYSIPFPVISDSDAAILEAFHVVNAVDEKQLAALKGYGIDLAKSSGKAHHKIAIPAYFLVDKSGVILWAHSDTDYKVRPTSAQLLTAVDAALAHKSMK